MKAKKKKIRVGGAFERCGIVRRGLTFQNLWQEKSPAWAQRLLEASTRLPVLQTREVSHSPFRLIGDQYNFSSSR